jgi:hypothetical protein
VRSIALALLAAFSVSAAAAPGLPVAYFDTGTGAVINLYDDKGDVCVGEALRAEYVVPGKPEQSVSGCYRVAPEIGVVFFVFFDGEVARVPMAALRQANA